MNKNSVREKLLGGQPSLGTFLGLGSPQVTEVLARAGLDWLVVECEHSAVDIAQAEDMLRAMNGSDTVPIIRLPAADPVWIQRSLDIGAMGIVVPMVKTPEEAQKIVDATRYPPKGKRGFGPLRASQYTLDYEDYVANVDENILIALILETKEFVDNMEAIAAIDGIDVITLGVRDLCFSLGLDIMNATYDVVDDVIEKMLAVSRKTGVALGIHAYSPEELRTLQNRGFHMLSYKTDYMMLIDQVREGRRAFE